MSELALKRIRENKELYEKDPEKAKFLDLGNCGLVNTLPSQILDCIWIEELNLGDYYFARKELIKSPNLGHHNLFTGHKLSLIANLINLKGLHFRNNQISNVNFLEKLTNLISLNLSYNQITDISSIQNLSKLNLLNISSNQINDTYFLEKLTKLITLNLSKNRINNVSFLKNLTNLISLDLSYNKVSNLYFLKELTNLDSLNLSNNPIYDLDFLKNLKNLFSLDLSGSQINDVSCLEKLTNLRYLNLSNSQISDINYLEKLTSLISLDLHYNKIEDLSPISKLINLDTLDLSRNRISNISFLEQLINLRKLDLRSNLICDISSLKKLTNLTSLNLSENKINDISALSLLIKKNLDIVTEGYDFREKVNLRNNPISSPPPEIFKQGIEAIIRYFEKLEKEGKDYIYEAKLTLVGDGGSGKTSLQRKILNENASLPLGDERTRGIEVIDWPFSDKEGNNYTAHIWDFGGQDVYYPVHRFFLTDNSVYVLMASTRFLVHNFEYWIPTIYQFGGKSPIVLVQNCDNGNQKSWDDVNVFYTNPEYNLRKPFYKVNLLSADTAELKKLKSYLEQQVADLPHIGKPVPKSWVKVRESLQDKVKQTDTITYTDFEILCRTVDDEAFEKAIDIEDLGKFLHDLGIILWYYEKPELRHLVILKPEWAMNAVYKIIDDEPIQKQNGVIRQEDFERIWQEEKYRGKTHELKVMLQVFKIAFPKKHNKKDFILPARLLPIEEKNKWESNQPYLRLEYHFEFMPRGIVNQVSAELSKSILSDESVWNNAVTFKNQNGEAQMIEEYHLRKIQIKAKGRDARGLMLMIMDAVVDIVKEYRGVHPTIKVPCSCNECQNLDKPTTFEYDELVSLLNKNRKEVTCNKGDIRLPIFELLHSVGLEFRENEILFESKTEHLPKQTEEIPEIFFSYAWDKAGETESREKIVNELYQSLLGDNFKVIIDKADLPYRESISEFMQRIGKGDIIVVAISDAYIKSPNCMYEFYEIFKESKLNPKFVKERIIPIHIEKVSLGDADVLINYMEHWQNEKKKWDKLNKTAKGNMGKLAETHKRVQAINLELGDFLHFLADINSDNKEELTKNNFEKIKSAIKQRIGQ